MGLVEHETFMEYDFMGKDGQISYKYDGKRVHSYIINAIKRYYYQIDGWIFMRMFLGCKKKYKDLTEYILEVNENVEDIEYLTKVLTEIKELKGDIGIFVEFVIGKIYNVDPKNEPLQVIEKSDGFLVLSLRYKINNFVGV